MPVAIITGASRGLGLAVATGLAAAGWRLVLDARDGPALSAAMSAAMDGLPGVLALPGDLTEPAHRAALVAAADRPARPPPLRPHRPPPRPHPPPAPARAPPARP